MTKRRSDRVGTNHAGTGHAAARTAAPEQTRTGSGNLNDLLVRVGGGDADAYRQVYVLTAEHVYGRVMRIVRDAGPAEEVAKDALVEVWRSAAHYDPRADTAMAWIVALARRRAIGRVRGERPPSPGEPPSPSADVGRGDLGELTDLQSHVVEMTYFQGYTYREVAETLGVSLPTITRCIRTSLLRLNGAFRTLT